MKTSSTFLTSRLKNADHSSLDEDRYISWGRLRDTVIPASGFNTQAAWTSSNFAEAKLRPVPPLAAVLDSAALLDDAGIKPAIQSIPIENNQPRRLRGVVDSFCGDCRQN
ncbi:MAG: hypothetical protein LBK13_13090 [Spirochaetales bacterium]|jgi:hypothetical protein|nr:hypothetical protein [Spirochaetales bacterium]